MIFITIGTQAPFDRLIQIIDKIAPLMHEPIVAQIFKGKYRPKHIQAIDFLPPDEFEKLFEEARLIVAHAGMGTIITAMAKGKPIIVFPRIAALGEHRNEHQLATAHKMKDMKYIYSAFNEAELKELLLATEMKCLHQVGNVASSELIKDLSDFIKS